MPIHRLSRRVIAALIAIPTLTITGLVGVRLVGARANQPPPPVCHEPHFTVKAPVYRPGTIWYTADRGDLAGVKKALRAAPRRANAKDPSGGNTPLNLAIAGGHFGVVRYLVAHGADVNGLDSRDNTPLHMAVVWGGRHPNQLAILDCLLAHGADVNARTRQGMTPLHYAVQFAQDPAVVRHMLARGADVNARSVRGLSVLQHARRFGSADIVRLLVQSGATG